jgi:electron transfer flavoprotein alpha subunit
MAVQLKLSSPIQPVKMIPLVGHSVLRQARTQLRQRNGVTPVASLSALARLLSSLAVLEQKDGKLNHGSLGAVTAAQKLGGSIVGFVAGGNIKFVAEEAAKVKGIEKIIAVDNAAYDKV